MTDRQQLVTDIFNNMSAMRRLMMSPLPTAKKKPTGPTHAQMGVMFCLSHNNNIGVKDLAKCFDMTSSAATQLINGLVKRGWVTRKTTTADRRKHALHLSPTGQRILKNIIAQRSADLAKHLQVLSDKELTQLKNIQQKIIANHR